MVREETQKESGNCMCSQKHFTGKKASSDIEFILNKKYTPNKAMYIDYLAKYVLQIKRLVKAILVSFYYMKRYRALIKIILK